jgi:hypothetical protein
MRTAALLDGGSYHMHSKAHARGSRNEGDLTLPFDR